MRLMCSRNRTEVEGVKNELLKAGIASETRPLPVADGLGVGGLELWVQNERDFFDASKLYARLQDHAANRVETPATNRKAGTSARPVSGPEPQVERAGAPAKYLGSFDSQPVAQPGRLELEQAGSRLRQGIEEMLLREGELAGECASLRGKVKELTRALAQAQADIAREIKSREAAERNQTEQLTGLVDNFERERREWQQQLKCSNETFKNAQEQVDSLSRLLQTQQAETTALRQELAALECQRDQETVAEREARTVAEQRASLAEESLLMQQVQREELERQIQAHVAGLGSLLAGVVSKAAAGSSQP
jgi:hypothetical protein